MIEAKGNIEIIQYETDGKLRTKVVVDILHDEEHDVMVNQLVSAVGPIINVINPPKCMHMTAHLPREKDGPREHYCILCGRKVDWSKAKMG